MANTKISALLAGAPVLPTDKIPAARTGVPGIYFTAADLGLPIRPVLPTNLSVAIAKTLGGISDTKLLFIGDSTTFGKGATRGSTDIIAQIAKRVAKALAVPVIDNWIVPMRAGDTDDSRVALGAGWTGLSGYGWGNNALFYNPSGISTTSTFTYTSGFSNKIRIYFARYGGAPGVFTPTVNSVGLASQSMAGAVGVGIYEATYTRAATATVVITPTTPLNLILGIEFLDTQQKNVYLCNAGIQGSVASDFSIAGTYATSAMLAAYTPTFTMLNFGINESVLSVSSASYASNLTTLITALKAYGDVDMWSFFGSDPALTAVVALQTAYRSQLTVLADTLGCTVLDLSTRSGGYAYMLARSLMFDQYHPNAAGYGLVVPTLVDRLLSFA